MSETELRCEYSIRKEGDQGVLVTACVGCAGSANLRDQRCLAALSRVLREEYGIAQLVLSHHVEKRYRGAAMDYLQLLVGLDQALDEMAARLPAQRYPVVERERPPCQTCDHHPPRMYGDLADSLRQNPFRFHAALATMIGPLRTLPRPACRPCIEDTAGDVAYLIELLDGLEALALGVEV